MGRLVWYFRGAITRFIAQGDGDGGFSAIPTNRAKHYDDLYRAFAPSEGLFQVRAEFDRS